MTTSAKPQNFTVDYIYGPYMGRRSVTANSPEEAKTLVLETVAEATEWVPSCFQKKATIVEK